MQDDVKSILSKMDYLTKLVDLVGKESLINTSAAIFYEAVWSVKYISNILPKVTDSHLRDSLDMCNSTLNAFVESVNVSKINYECNDEVSLLQLKYNDLDICSAQGELKPKLSFNNTLKELIIWTGILAIFDILVCTGKDSSTKGLAVLCTLSDVLFKCVLGFVGITIICQIVIAFVRMLLPQLRYFGFEEYPPMLEDKPEKIYRRDQRNIQWLDLLRNDVKYKVRVEGRIYALANSVGSIKYFEELAEIENLYMEYMEDKSK